MQKRTKNHPQVAVHSQISTNLLKKPAPQKDLKFLSSWFSCYKCLRYENDLMFCVTCLTAKACSNPFTEGCTNFQNSTLIRHQDSKAHETSIKTLQMKSHFSRARSGAEIMKEHSSSEKIDSYVKQLRTVYMRINKTSLVISFQSCVSTFDN